MRSLLRLAWFGSEVVIRLSTLLNPTFHLVFFVFFANVAITEIMSP